MTAPGFAALAAQHTLGDEPVPEVVLELAPGRPAKLAWRNEMGGLTFRIGDEFVKWNRRRTGVDLAMERSRLEWLENRHPAPRVIGYGEDAEAQWLVTAALPGGSAVGDAWRARRSEAIRAIATGLTALHAVSIDDFPAAPMGKRILHVFTAPRAPLGDG